MSITFPQIAPSTIQFLPAKYSSILPDFLGVIASPRDAGGVPDEAELNLEFNNIKNTDVTAILDAYKDSRSGVHPVSLPEEILLGIESNELYNRIKSVGYEWFFIEKKPPEVNSSSVPGRRSVRLSLIARLAGLSLGITAPAPAADVDYSQPGFYIDSEEECVCIPPQAPLGVYFRSYEVGLSVVIDRNLADPPVKYEYLDIIPLTWVTQDGIKILLGNLPGINVIIKLQEGPGEPGSIFGLGQLQWSTGGDNVLGYSIVMDYGITRPHDYHHTFASESLALTVGIVCYNMANLVCTREQNGPPWTHQTYGQAVPDFEGTMPGWDIPTTNLGYGVKTFSDRRQGIAELVPPYPFKKWFSAYINNAGGTVATSVIFSANVTHSISLKITRYFPVSIFHIGNNRFRVQTTSSRGALVILRYNGYSSFSGNGLPGPTIVKIKYNETHTDFSTVAEANQPFTVLIDAVFGLPYFEAQFWPLEIDVDNNAVMGP